jgi:hypothetical protein
MMLYTPTSKYDGHLVRGRVTDLATKEWMAENWDKAIHSVPGAPPREEYSSKYHRVKVRAEKIFGGGYFGYPFVPKDLKVEKGDLVEFFAVARTPSNSDFSYRESIVRIVCKNDDIPCLESPEGRMRGIVEPQMNGTRNSQETLKN